MNAKKGERIMKKFISWWMGLGVASAVIAIDFYLAIHSNQHPTGEQLLCGYFMVTFFSILALVFIGAHIEEYYRKQK